jgi:hypothetical protein
MDNITTELIFQYLTWNELKRVRCVCRRWNNIASLTINHWFSSNPWIRMKQLYQSGYDRMKHAIQPVYDEVVIYLDDDYETCSNCADLVKCANSKNPWILYTCAETRTLCYECSEHVKCSTCNTERVRPEWVKGTRASRDVVDYYNNFCRTKIEYILFFIILRNK